MLSISAILLQGSDIESFAALKEAVREHIRREGAVFLQFDVRPPFSDTPEDWQEQLEAVFIDKDAETRRR